jgi:PAS domain-containing protein
MATLASTSPHTILDDLHQSLDHVVTTLNQKWTETPLTLKPLASPSVEDEQRSFQLEGPDPFSVRVHFAVFPLGGDTFELQIEVEGGPIRRLTYVSAGDNPDPEKQAQLGRKVSVFLLEEIEPRLGRCPVQSSAESHSTVPRIDLDREGTIQRLNADAAAILESSPGEDIDRNFFSHVDGHNLRRVTRDLTQMECHDMKQARWLLRLRTGESRWQWYRAVVRNNLQSEGTIQVDLCPLKRP